MVPRSNRIRIENWILPDPVRHEPQSRKIFTLGSAGGSQERRSVSPCWLAERLRGGLGSPSLVRTTVTGAWTYSTPSPERFTYSLGSEESGYGYFLFKRFTGQRVYVYAWEGICMQCKIEANSDLNVSSVAVSFWKKLEPIFGNDLEHR